MPKAGYQVSIRRAVGPTTTTSLGLTHLGNGVFRVSTASTRMINPAAPWCICSTGVGNATVTPASISAGSDLLFGEITAATGATTYFLVGQYLTLDFSGPGQLVTEVKSHSIDESREMLDTTVYSGGTRAFRQRMVGLGDASLQLDMLTSSSVNPFLATLFSGGSLAYFEVNNGASMVWRMLGRIENMNDSIAVDGLVETSVTVQVSAERTEPYPHVYTAISERLI